MSDLVAVVSLSLFGGALALLGGIVLLSAKTWSQWLSRASIPFSAGILLSVSLVGLLPEAFHALEEKASIVILFSFLGAFLFEHLLFGIHHHEDHPHESIEKGSVALVLFGDTIHNFVDGVAIAAAYLINPGLGVVTAFSTFLHEVPHEMSDFGILLAAGWKRSSIFIVNLISSLATVIGALLVLWTVPNEKIIGYLLAITCGIFLYLGASDFLPHVASKGRGKNKAIFTLIAGVLVMLATLYVVPHSHEKETQIYLD